MIATESQACHTHAAPPRSDGRLEPARRSGMRADRALPLPSARALLRVAGANFWHTRRRSWRVRRRYRIIERPAAEGQDYRDAGRPREDGVRPPRLAQHMRRLRCGDLHEGATDRARSHTFRAIARVWLLSCPDPRRAGADGADGGPMSSTRRGHKLSRTTDGSLLTWASSATCCPWCGGILHVAPCATSRGSAHGEGASARLSGAL